MLNIDIDSVVKKILVSEKKPLTYYCAMLGVNNPVEMWVDIATLNHNYGKLTFLRSYPEATEAFTFVTKVYDTLKEAVTYPDSQAYLLLKSISDNNLEVNYLAFNRLLTSKGTKNLVAKRKCINFEVLFHREERDKLTNITAISDISPNALKTFDNKVSCFHKVLINTDNLSIYTSESKWMKKRPHHVLFACDENDFAVLRQNMEKLYMSKRAAAPGYLSSAFLFFGQLAEDKIKYGDLYLRAQMVKTMELPGNRLECKWTEPHTGKMYTEILGHPIAVVDGVKLYKSKNTLINPLMKKVNVFLEVKDDI